MDVSLPLERMTVAEKLRVLERIWDDLSRSEPTLPSPQWHGDVLRAREKRVRENQEKFTEWEKAKGKIRESIP